MGIKRPIRHPYSNLKTDPAIMEDCVSIIRSGGIALFPTDTVYGVGCRADREESVEAIFTLKRRSKGLAIPVLLADQEDILKYGMPTDEALELIRNGWPGALTIVVGSGGLLASNLSSTGSLGFRCPDEPVIRDLIRRLGVPLAATSANVSGEPEILSPEEMPAESVSMIDLIIDAGKLPRRKPSKVIDCTCSPPKVLRD